MKLKNKILFFVSILTFLSACSSSDRGDVLSEDDMINILVDIHMLEANVTAIKLKKDSTQRVYNTLELATLSDYNVDKAYYENSYRYYLAHPEKLQLIYTRVIDSLNVINQNANFEEEQEKEQKKKEKEEKKEREEAEEERLRREKEGLPSLEEIAEILEYAKGEFVGPETLAVRSYQEEFEFLLEGLRRDSLATIYLDSLAMEEAKLDSLQVGVDSLQVDSTAIVVEGKDSVAIDRKKEKKIWKANLPEKKSEDSTEVEKKAENY